MPQRVEDCDRWGVMIVSFGRNGTGSGLKCHQFRGRSLSRLEPLTILRLKLGFRHNFRAIKFLKTLNFSLDKLGITIIII